MIASSAESLSRKRGNASSDLSSATSLIAARRRTATFIRTNYGGGSMRDMGDATAADSFPKPDDLPGERRRRGRAEKRHRRRDVLALDVTRVGAHRGLVRGRPNGRRCESV